MSRRASFAEFLEAAELPDDPQPVVLSKFPTPRGPAVARGPGRPASNHLRGSSSSRTATAQPAAARRGSRLFSGSLFGGSSLSGAAISSSSRGPVVAPRCEPLIQASAEVEACGKSFGEGQAATHSVSASGAASSFVADVAPQASGPAGPLAAMQHFSVAIANSERGHVEAGSATFETPATPRRKRPVANDDGLLTPALEQKRNVRSMPRWGTDGSEASFAKRRKGHDGESIQAALEDAISAPSFPGGVSEISGRGAAQPATIIPEKRSAAFGKTLRRMEEERRVNAEMEKERRQMEAERQRMQEECHRKFVAEEIEKERRQMEAERKRMQEEISRTLEQKEKSHREFESRLAEKEQHHADTVARHSELESKHREEQQQRVAAEQQAQHLLMTTQDLKKQLEATRLDAEIAEAYGRGKSSRARKRRKAKNACKIFED